MKCDELKVRTVYVDWKGANICYYDPYEVDSAIAELKAENERLKNEKKKMYTKLQHDTIIDAMSRSHHKELRATKRALYKACANWMRNRQIVLKCFEFPVRAEKFYKAIDKCRAKAEEYK